MESPKKKKKEKKCFNKLKVVRTFSWCLDRKSKKNPPSSYLTDCHLNFFGLVFYLPLCRPIYWFFFASLFPKKRVRIKWKLWVTIVTIKKAIVSFFSCFPFFFIKTVIWYYCVLNLGCFYFRKRNRVWYFIQV